MDFTDHENIQHRAKNGWKQLQMKANNFLVLQTFKIQAHKDIRGVREGLIWFDTNQLTFTFLGSVQVPGILRL